MCYLVVLFLEIIRRLGSKLFDPMSQPTLIIYHCDTGRNLIFLSKTWGNVFKIWSNRVLVLSLPLPECRFWGDRNCFLLCLLHCLEQQHIVGIQWLFVEWLLIFQLLAQWCVYNVLATVPLGIYLPYLPVAILSCRVGHWGFILGSFVSC